MERFTITLETDLGETALQGTTKTTVTVESGAVLREEAEHAIDGFMLSLYGGTDRPDQDPYQEPD